MKRTHFILKVIIIAVILTIFALVQTPVAGEYDSIIQAAQKDYEALKTSLVKKYEDGYKQAGEKDNEYRRQHDKSTIRHQVSNWKWTATDGYNAMFGFIKSQDFDKANIIKDNYHYHQALSMPIRYKDKWAEEIRPAYSAVQSCCATDDINECHCVILKKVFPYFRDFSNKIEGQVGGFYRSLDQSKLNYYDDYYKKTQTFTYTWPKNVIKLLNFFKGEHYDQEFRSRKVSGCDFGQPSLLNIDIRSNEGRSQGLFVSLYYNKPNSSLVWFKDILEGGKIIDRGSNHFIVKYGDSYYYLIHFFKGRKSLGVVYTMQTDKTVDAMVRYMIFALKDYVLSGSGSPGTEPDEAPADEHALEVGPFTSTNLNTTPNKGNTCELEIIVADKGGVPVASTEVVFEPPEFGTLSSLKITTNASGKAQVKYTAPTDLEIAKTGKKQIDVYVNAKESATGVKGYEVLHIRSAMSDMVASVQHPILPAHPNYHNKIVFKFQAADKTDGSAYTARITTKGQYTALAKTLREQGGTNTLTMDVWNNSDCTLFYRWVGPPTMKQALEEIVTIEIPELKLKQEVAFSVGIDLQIVSVQRAYSGTLFPIMWEPFHITVMDGFHPKADLAKLLNKFNIKTDLTMKQVHFTPAPVHPGETGFLSALLTRIEGASGSSLQDAVIWDVGKWEVQKTRGMKYVLIQKGTYEDGKPWMEYPSLVFWERGTYQFKAAIRPGMFDADPRNNTVLTELYEVKEFRGFSDEIIHTVFMPSAEFLASVVYGFSESLPIKMALCTKSLAGDLHAKNYTDAIVDLFGCFVDVVGDSKVAKKIKDWIPRNTLALYVKTLCDTMAGGKEKKAIAVKKPVVTSAQTRASNEPLSSEARLKKVLEIAQKAVQGTGDSYIVILQKEGLVSYSAGIAGGAKLLPAPHKLGTAQTESQRIEQGERFIVVPASTQEKIKFELKGNGNPGAVIVVTDGFVRRHAYLTSPWEATITVNSSGNADYELY